MEPTKSNDQFQNLENIAQGKEKEKKSKKNPLTLEVLANKGFLANFFHNYKKQLSETPKNSKPEQGLKEVKAIKEGQAASAKLPNYKVLFNNYVKPDNELLKTVRLDQTKVQTGQLLKIIQTEIGQKIMENNQKNQGFNINEIPVNKFEKLGIPQDTLLKSGILEKLLKGEKSQTMENISITGKNGNKLNYSASFQLKRNEDGTIGIDVTHKKQNIVEKITEKAIGRELTPEMKKEIQEKGITKIENISNHKGENLFAYAFFNKLSNKVQLLYPQKLELPDQIKGITITKDQQKDLREGKSIRLEGMTAKDGSKFTADVKVNPEKKSLTFNNPIAAKIEITDLSKKAEMKNQNKNQQQEPSDKKSKGIRI